MTKNNWLLQFLSDMLNLTVSRHTCIETSALGAALLAGLGKGIYKNTDEISRIIRHEKSFSPTISEAIRERYYTDWKKAILSILTPQ